MWETWVWALGWEDPLEKGTSTHSIFWPGEFHGLCSPWVRKESDITDWLSLHYCIIVVWSLGCVWLLATPSTAAHQAPLSFTVSQYLLKFMFFESVMLSNHPIVCCPLLLLPSIFPIIGVFSNEFDSSLQVAKVLELQLQFFQWIFRVDFL